MTTPRDLLSVPAAPRTIAARAGVGAAGHIVQRSDLTTHRVEVDQATLILVESGRKRIRWAHGELAAGPGEALSLQPGAVVDISNMPGRDGSYRALWLVWSPALIKASCELPRMSTPTVARHTRLGADFHETYRRALASLDPREGPPARIATHRLEEVLLWLQERGFRFESPDATSSSIGRRVRRLLATDPSADWAMPHVADGMATSVPTLRRKLARENLNFRDLVQDVRMSHALALLQNTDTPVLQVALASGYDSPSRFTARFRARYGYLPTDVRGERRNRSANSKATS